MLLISVALVMGAPAYADVIYDQAGGTMKGLVVEEHRDRIVVNTEAGEKTVLRNDIEEVFYAEPERNYLYLGHQALDAGDFGIARGFFQKALQINPGLAEAADALERTSDLEKKQLSPGDPLAELETKWGMKLAAGERFVAAAGVQPGSFSQRSGIADGDSFVSSWSSSLAFLGPFEVARELIGPAGSRIKLTIQRSVRLPAGGSAGLKLDMERLGLTVDAAEKSGGLLRAGDRIVSIAGKPTRYMPLPAAWKLIRQAAGKGIDLEIHRDLLLTRE